MDDKELAVLAATILSGIIVGERLSADEKTLKRSIDLAYRLKTLITERLSTESVQPRVSNNLADPT